ncbi:hypothetical protein A2U01_0117232, partial [Trifolium medium]|nr:hypothetical protein [Trifolium medium]
EPTLTSESELILAPEALQLQRLYSFRGSRTSEALETSEAEIVPEAEYVHSLDYQSNQYSSLRQAIEA